MTRGDVTACQNASEESATLLIKTAASGMSTISDRYARVNPSDSPKPGKTLWARTCAISA